jgi:ATP phosphoribosyltransferase regulatory subunit
MDFLKIEDEVKFSHKMFILKREIEQFLCEEGYRNIEPSIYENYDEFTGINFRVDKKIISKTFRKQWKYIYTITRYNNRNS